LGRFRVLKKGQTVVYCSKTAISKLLFILFFAISLALLAQAARSQLPEEIKTAAHIYAFAQVNEYLEMIMDMTYPELVEKAGGEPKT
jgi:hypothetical protein